MVDDTASGGRLVLQWVPVHDDRGHTRMEMRWTVPVAAGAATRPAA